MRLFAAVLTGALAILGAVTIASPSDASRQGRQIKIYDDCDPASFNATFGQGVCVGRGRTTANDFLAELAATRAAKDWRFKPSMLRLHDGRPVILENRGGETHTFTMVKSFGGGFIAPLNQLSGTPEPAPECAAMVGDQLIPTPPSAVNVFVAADHDAAFRTAGLKKGKYLFQCCVHPWMRVVLTVR